ncbi:MAG: hypothetical protein ACYC1M_00160 [Armatimonadota bacterium]
MVRMVVSLGLMFSIIAALAAFLITYDEWTRHYSSGGKPLLYGLRSSLVAFVVFMMLTMLIVIFAGRL